MNGSDHTSALGMGRVEICYNNSYFAVCDDLWDVFDAGIVCRQLGFTFSSEIIPCPILLNFIGIPIFLRFISCS